MNGEVNMSTAQQQFAERHRAHPGSYDTRNPSAVYMYRADADGTDRWLVHESGAVLDTVRFDRSAG